MALHLVLDDFRASGVHYTAGTLVDDDQVGLAGLQAAGLAAIPYTAGGDLEAARTAYLAQRGGRPRDQDPPSLTALLGARGLLPAQSRTSQVVLTYKKDAADGAAATATAETSIGVTDRARILTAAYINPDAALTADVANNATINVYKGDASTLVASITTSPAGSGSWVAFTPIPLDLQSEAIRTLAAGESLSFEITKGGTGVVVPASSISLVLEEQ